jgi:hypothetical protein
MKIISVLGCSTQENSFKVDGAIKIFHNIQKQKQYLTTKQPLQKVLQGILHTESESKQNYKRT